MVSNAAVEQRLLLDVVVLVVVNSVLLPGGNVNGVAVVGVGLVCLAPYKACIA